MAQPSNEPPQLLRTGDAVVLTTDTGREVEAVVKLASLNGRSLALTFDGMVYGWLGGVAVFFEAGAWRTLDGMVISIRLV